MEFALEKIIEQEVHTTNILLKITKKNYEIPYQK